MREATLRTTVLEAAEKHIREVAETYTDAESTDRRKAATYVLARTLADLLPAYVPAEGPSVATAVLALLPYDWDDTPPA